MGGTLTAVRESVLLYGVQTGVASLAGDALEAAAVAFFLIGVVRLKARGRRWPGGRTACFLSGVLLIWVAVGSGLAAYDDTVVTLHVVQHVLLMMVAPPLLVSGRPLVLASQAAGRRNQVRLNRLLRGRAVRAVTHPALTWTVYFGAMWAIFVDAPVYGYLVTHEAAHDASHVLILLAGLLYWQPLLAGDGPRRLPLPARMLALMAAMPLEAVPGLWLHFRSTTIVSFDTLADTRLAGQVFLIAAVSTSTAWLAVLAGRWFALALREERRDALHRSGDEWTVPWWVAGPLSPPE